MALPTAQQRPPPAAGPSRTRSGATFVSVAPGDQYVTNNPDETVVTLLGSCVAACARDTVTGVGGLNHFLLPSSDQHDLKGYRRGDALRRLRHGAAAEHASTARAASAAGSSSRSSAAPACWAAAPC